MGGGTCVRPLRQPEQDTESWRIYACGNAFFHISDPGKFKTKALAVSLSLAAFVNRWLPSHSPHRLGAAIYSSPKATNFI